ncbi:MAG: hypothetical protein FJZ97_11275, partial [Chloroflexi bacterium]|nr:hypothetical protein [Chloroflexota bacterium]
TASLRKSEQAKSAFLADVTHELRTPLTVIKGTIETLEDGALDDAEGRGPLLASMERETDRLIRLVGELLVLTRADAGALGLKLMPVDTLDLARQRCATLGAVAARRGLKLSVEAGEGEAAGRFVIQGDSDRLAQVLDNLLDNAIRHAPQGSTIVVELQADGAEVSCTVSDHGPGIPPEHLPFIFERFYRVDVARDRAAGGAGLGLAIARALVEAHGGRINARTAPGRGTTISFRLPVARRMPAS